MRSSAAAQNGEYINKVLARHSIKEPDGNTDISEIIGKEENYIDEYDKEILDRNKKDIYKLIEINEKGFSAGFTLFSLDSGRLAFSVFALSNSSKGSVTFCSSLFRVLL